MRTNEMERFLIHKGWTRIIDSRIMFNGRWMSPPSSPSKIRWNHWSLEDAFGLAQND